MDMLTSSAGVNALEGLFSDALDLWEEMDPSSIGVVALNCVGRARGVLSLGLEVTDADTESVPLFSGVGGLRLSVYTESLPSPLQPGLTFPLPDVSVGAADAALRLLPTLRCEDILLR